MRVLVVEDEPYIAEEIGAGRHLEGIAADLADDTVLGVPSIDRCGMVVPDRDLPRPSGDEIAERVGASGSGPPILILTAAYRWDDKASGFEPGAEDHPAKPFEVMELVLRFESIRRRSGC